MTEKVKLALRVLREQAYKSKRITIENYDLTEQVIGLPHRMRRPAMLTDMLSRETPNFLEGDIYGFNRTVKNIPFYTDKRGKLIRASKGNYTINYDRLISGGFDAALAFMDERSEKLDEDRLVFYAAMREYIAAVYDLCDRYRTAAEEQGITCLAEALKTIPRKGATSLYEACLFQRIILFALHCTGALQLTIGRFDQYMYPYFKADIDRGVSREELLETLELYFISMNVDGDLYIGLQQGDNGQSMVLGGYDADGNEMFNELSALCMDASLELSLIDPKINLRVSKKTPDWLYEYGTKLTKQGLGFPQYCNDDVIVPFLTSLGYEKEDALDYTVAACWETIIPNCGADHNNRGVMNFPREVNRAVHKHLLECETFEELMERACDRIKQYCYEMRDAHSFRLHPSSIQVDAHFISLFIDGCLEKGLDVTQGAAKYNNYGSHGAGIANAADALAAIRKTVYEEKSVGKQELLDALNANFVGYEEVRNRLLACPKMGNNDDYVDELACRLMDAFAGTLNGLSNEAFGVWRAGTGSAQEYVRSSCKVPATADGRLEGDVYGCSYSPALTSKLDGPLSVIQSFTKFDLSRISNGGPLTIELHDTVFRNEEGEKKVSQLVKAFVHLGGHQLQLNSINRDRLIEAQEHPEDFPNLIVRVWGWSGYFCELDKAYQDHIIRRTEFMV